MGTFLPGFLLSAQTLVVVHVPVAPLLPCVLFGLAGEGGNLGCATLAAHFGSGTAGRAQSAANLLLFALPWALQRGIGEMLDSFSGAVEGSVDPAGYRWAFGLVLVLQILAVIWYLRANRRN